MDQILDLVPNSLRLLWCLSVVDGQRPPLVFEDDTFSRSRKTSKWLTQVFKSLDFS
jgi:hypothetical protein